MCIALESPAAQRRRRGFGLVEIVVLLAIASVIAVLTVPALVQANRIERVQQTMTILDRTRLALYNPTNNPPAFNQTVGDNAGSLSHLVIPIANGDLNSCGQGYKVPTRNNWPNAGPYGGFNIDPNVGLVTPIGIGNDLLVRNPAGGGGVTGTLAIVFPNVDIADVLLLDGMVDDADGLNAGLIQWTAPAGGLTTFSYTMTIDGNC